MAGPEELCWRSKPLAASSGNRLLVQAVMDTCPQLTMRSIRLQKSTVHPFGFSGPLNGGDRPVCDYSAPTNTAAQVTASTICGCASKF